MRRWWFAACGLVALLASSGVTADTNPKLPGIFSNLAYHEEAGDLLGIEIIVVPAGSGYAALVQHAEGSVHQPVLVPVQFRAGEVSFALPDPCPCGLAPGLYEANLSLGALRIRGPVDSEQFEPKEVTLPRGPSYWQ